MRTLFILFIISNILTSCVDKIEFTIPRKEAGIVVEGFISNKSYEDTRTYPSDGRYFKVVLSETSDVTNVKSEPITGANIYLKNDINEEFLYQEDATKPGTYFLLDKDFSAKYNRKYKLFLTTKEGDEFSSEWEKMAQENTEIEEVIVNEKTIDGYVFNSGQKEVKEFDGMEVSINVPINLAKTEKYYRWTFEPLWIYKAPEAKDNSGVKTCWIRSPYYLNQYVLQKDIIGEYGKALFFMETKGNERIYEYFSVLITQSLLTEEFYYFWKDLEAQREKGGLYDQPPYNLATNLKPLNNDRNVNGYFGVVAETAKRWVFDRTVLSYPIDNNLDELCKIVYGPPAPGDILACKNCLGYINGQPTTVKPWWW